MRYLFLQLLGLFAPILAVIGMLTGCDLLFGKVPPPFQQPYYATSAALLEALSCHDSALNALNKLGEEKYRFAMWRNDLAFKIAKSEFLMGNFAQARTIFHELNGSGVKNNFALIYEGICEQKTGGISKAETIFTQAISTFPNRHDAYIARGHLLLLNNRPADAERDYSAGAERAAVLGPVWVDIGDAYALTGDMNTANKMYKKAESVDPWDPFSQFRLAEYAYCTLHQNDVALNHLNTCLKAMPGWTPVSRLNQIIARNGQCPDYMSLADIPFGEIRSWEVIPCRLLIEYQRPDWQGYETD